MLSEPGCAKGGGRNLCLSTRWYVRALAAFKHEPNSKTRSQATRSLEQSSLELLFHRAEKWFGSVTCVGRGSPVRRAYSYIDRHTFAENLQFSPSLPT